MLSLSWKRLPVRRLVSSSITSNGSITRSFSSLLGTAPPRPFPEAVDGGAKRFFTATPVEKHGGKPSRPHSQSVAAATAQKAGGGKSNIQPPPSSQHQTGGEGMIPPSIGWWSQKHLIYVGVGSAVVVAALAIYRGDVLKRTSPGEKDFPGMSEKTKGPLESKQEEEEKMIGSTIDSKYERENHLIESREENGALTASHSTEASEHAKEATNESREESEALTRSHVGEKGEDAKEAADESREENEALTTSQMSERSEDAKEAINAESFDDLVNESGHIGTSTDKSIEVPKEVDNHMVQPHETFQKGAESLIDSSREKSYEESRTQDATVELLNPETSSIGAHWELSALPDEDLPEHGLFEDSQVTVAHQVKNRPDLSETYLIPINDGTSTSKFEGHQLNEPEAKEVGMLLKIKKDEFSDSVSPKYHENIRDAFDMLEVIHAAEQRQADIDARRYHEEQRKLKELFERELKDARAKEVMYAEEADRLAKEIAQEKDLAVAALKLYQEKAEERLEKELQLKEEEASHELKRAILLGKTQTAAAVTQEKVAHLKDINDVNLQLEALHVAFYTRSEEARQSHIVHKLSVGTFAMEEAVKQGVSVEKEVALLQSAAGPGIDPLIDAAIQSLSDETIRKGTRTPAQLHQMFEEMKGELRELVLMPAGSGGLLSHVAAKVVSILKVKENGRFSDGIEAVISQVHNYLANGDLVGAADILEKSVQGTKAEDLVKNWVKNVRDRAAMEQILLLLQSHATAVASSLV